jgi:hypothetical protein
MPTPVPPPCTTTSPPASARYEPDSRWAMERSGLDPNAQAGAAFLYGDLRSPPKISAHPLTAYEAAVKKTGREVRSPI